MSATTNGHKMPDNHPSLADYPKFVRQVYFPHMPYPKEPGAIVVEVEKLVTRGDDALDLAGEVIATLKLNLYKGLLGVTPSVSESFVEMLDKWHERYMKIKSS